MTREYTLLLYNSSCATKGGGIISLEELAEVLTCYGYSVEAVSNPNPSHSDLLDRFKKADLIYWYGESSAINELRLVKLASKLKKPVIRQFGGTILVRRPDRPLYLLTNISMALNIFVCTKLHSMLFYAANNTDDFKLLKRLGVSALYIPRGIDTNTFKPAERKDKRFTIICNAAPASWVKGTDFLIKMLPKMLRLLDEEVLFIIITGGYGRSLFREKLKRFERENSRNTVCIDRFLSRLEICELLGKAHLLLFPSRFEGFGRLVLEAQSCGVLVVAFDIPGAPRDVIIPNLTGKLVKPYNLNEFIGEVKNLYEVWSSQPELYVYMQRRAREMALRFDWKIIGKLIIRQLDKVISSHV